MKATHMLLTAIALCSHTTFACIAGENVDIYFPENSSTLSNAQVLHLANWVVNQKLTYPDHRDGEIMLISGHAQPGEKKLQALSEARLKTGLALLGELGFPRGDIQTSTRVYPRDLVDDGRRVEIEFFSPCPNKCGPCE